MQISPSPKLINIETEDPILALSALTSRNYFFKKELD